MRDAIIECDDLQVITKDDGPDLCHPIYTTGAMLIPIKRVKKGKTYWLWTVSEFTDDCYYDGEVFNPPETAKTLEELMVNTTAVIDDESYDND